MSSLHLIFILSALLLLAGCGPTPTPEQSGPRILRIAVATAVGDSGVLDFLVERFQELHPMVTVQVTARGTRGALEAGSRGETDLMVTHDRAQEDKFLVTGQGVNRRDLMIGSFVLVGPPADPAGVRQAPTIVQAFQRIHEAEAPFVSRGDGGSTHARELSLWALCHRTPDFTGYTKANVGQLECLKLAASLGAYTVADRATFARHFQDSGLVVLLKDDPRLLNQYSILGVNPLLYTKTNMRDSLAFLDFATSPEGQALIGTFESDSALAPIYFTAGDRW